jgi:ADP-ribose pyrophosphatase YjhB (NUDIX family)
MKRLVRHGLHRLVHWFHQGRRLVWFFTHPDTRGVHAVAVTPEGEIVLVTLSYASGWRLPGGGCKPGEDPEQSILRELREEIGMTACGAVQQVMTFRQQADFKNDRSSLFVVRDVVFEPRWSLEIKAVGTFALDALPLDMPPITRRLLRAAAALL